METKKQFIEESPFHLTVNSLRDIHECDYGIVYIYMMSMTKSLMDRYFRGLTSEELASIKVTVTVDNLPLYGWGGDAITRVDCVCSEEIIEKMKYLKLSKVKKIFYHVKRVFNKLKSYSSREKNNIK